MNHLKLFTVIHGYNFSKRQAKDSVKIESTDCFFTKSSSSKL